jgi:type I restriction enzyme S subunit
MELIEKQSYKQTIIGNIPTDWIELSIGQLTDNIIDYRGVTPKKIGLDWGGGEIVALSAGNVKKGYIDFEAECYYGSEQLYKRWMRNGDVHENDIVFTLEAPLGNIALIPDKKKYILSQRTILLQLKKEYWPKYIFQLLISDTFQKYILQSATGSTAQGIKRTTFEKLKTVVPPTLEEQKAIATALSDVDELITNLDQLITKKKAIKQGAMQQLLTPPHKGGKRLEGFSGEWVEKVIGKIGNTFGGLSGKTKTDFENGKYPYITFLNVMNNTIIDSTIFEYVNIKSGEQQNKARKGDLFFNTSSETPEEVGMCAILKEEVKDLYLNSFCFGFRLKEDSDIDGLLFSYLINSPIGRNLFLSLAQGATRYNLSKSNFNKLIIELPPLKEQKAIAQILFDIDEEIKKLESKKEKYQSVKQGMMQELLTGKTRLI